MNEFFFHSTSLVEPCIFQGYRSSSTQRGKGKKLSRWGLSWLFQIFFYQSAAPHAERLSTWVSHHSRINTMHAIFLSCLIICCLSLQHFEGNAPDLGNVKKLSTEWVKRETRPFILGTWSHNIASNLIPKYSQSIDVTTIWSNYRSQITP